MKKYIDADKLTKNFEKMIDDIPASVDSGAGYVIDEVYKIIDSLQQEQIEVDIEKEIDEELDRNWAGHYIEYRKFAESAKYFYKLGLEAGKKK